MTSRRAFLRGKVADDAFPRPLGAVGEQLFRDLCTGCGDCARACPEGIIVRDTGGLPFVNVDLGACTFCAECITACETGALGGDRQWPWQARVTASCLSQNSVQCRACEDQCDQRAIRFRLQTGGRSVPRIDLDLCNGCGGCVAPCPVGAISLKKMKPQTEAHSC